MSQPEEPVMKRSQRKEQSQTAEKEHRGEELGRRRAEHLREAHSAEQSEKKVSRRKKSTANSRREEHTQQQARRAHPTAGEKSTPNSRRKEHTQQQGRIKTTEREQCQPQAETHEENKVSKKGIGPKTRDQDTESQQRMAADKEFKVAENAREHQVEIDTEIEVEKQKAAELRNQVRTVKKSLEEQQHKTDDVWKGVTQKQ